MRRVLVCDDDLSILKLLKGGLPPYVGCEVETVRSGEDALKVVQSRPPNVVLLDLNLPGIYGLNILKTLRIHHPEVPVIVMTGQPGTQVVINAMKDGAFEFLRKPFPIERMAVLVGKAFELSQPVRRSIPITDIPGIQEGSDAMLGNSSPMLEIFKLIGQVSQSDATVLIQGESGTGKEMVARAIYLNSTRRDKPFLAVNCAAIPETLLESELFGYERGAFTGATTRKIGKFEKCDKGTIFLDEIGDMSLPTQSKILRILQEGEFERVGGNQTIRVDVRVLAATNRDLELAIREKQFRLDLFYRLKVFSILIPPLRERPEDILLLARYFLSRYSKKNNKVIRSVTDDAVSVLEKHSWPGNVRELENCIERAVVIAQGEVIRPEHLQLLTPEVPGGDSLADFNALPADATLEDMERAYITHILRKTGGKMNQASAILKIHRNTLRRKIKALNISAELAD